MSMETSVCLVAAVSYAMAPEPQVIAIISVNVRHCVHFHLRMLVCMSMVVVCPMQSVVLSMPRATGSKGCELSSCNTGWKVSNDKSKCEANECSYHHGVGASEANCSTDGASKCESCDAGFKLASDSKSCTGLL